MPYLYSCGGDGAGGDPIFSDIGVPFFRQGLEESTPGLGQTLDTFTVPAGKTIVMAKIVVSGFIAGTWSADIDSVIIAAGRISSGHPESTFEFLPRRLLAESTTFSLKFTGRSPASDVHYSIMSIEI